MNFSIIPECYVDTNLIETIVPPAKENNQRGYNHKKGCSTVTKVIEEKFKGEFALGIIDKYQHEINYLKQFSLIINVGSLKLLKHNSEAHYVIYITDTIERMILNNANAAGIRLEDYGLSSDFETLKYQSKKQTSKKDIRFTSLFKALQTNNAPDIVKLAGWIKYLKRTNYNADLNAIKNL